MTEVGEPPKEEIIKNNIQALARTQAENTKESAEKAVQLAVQTTNYLVGREPHYSDNQLVIEAARARYEASGALKVWGDKSKEAVITGTDDQRKDPDLERKRAKVQEAVNAGLHEEMLRVAEHMAIRDKMKVLIEKKLLAMAGARSFTTSKEKLEVFDERYSDQDVKMRRAENWTVVKRINYDDLPEMKKLQELRLEALSK